MTLGEQFLSTLSKNVDFIKTVYIDLAQPAAKKAGQALETVIDVSNTILLPVKLINEKSKLIFQKNMQTYQKKLETVPEENIIEVQPELGIPILDKFTYVTNVEIGNLFASLLASASVKETAHLGHPGFLRIIENLSVDEARLIEYFSKNRDRFPYIYFRIFKEDRSYIEATDHLTGLELRVDLLFPNNMNFYLNNLSSLGILTCLPDKLISERKMYEDLEGIYSNLKDEISEQISKDNEFKEIVGRKGTYQLTSFGHSFINAIFGLG